MIYDLIVIGGGPAGIFGALSAANKGAKVLLLEKMDNPGKKILIAGSGKCNVTHEGEIKDFLKFYGDKGKFLRPSLYNYKPEDLKKFFKQNNLPLVLLEESGKYFPNTFSSVDVVNMLLKVLDKLGVGLLRNRKVTELSFIEDDNFLIKTIDKNYFAKNVLVATGGLSFPKTGSEGDGYRFAKSLGHKVIPTTPGLTPAFVHEYPFSELSGISFKNVSLCIYRDDKKTNEFSGPLLLTHKNFSGPVILNNSRYLNRNDLMEINFVLKPYELLLKEFLEYSSLNGKHSVKKYLSTTKLPDRFIRLLLKLSFIEDDKKISELSKKDRVTLLKNISSMPFKISRLGDFNVAMVTCGGVSLKEVNPKTMESKLQNGLYFAGEVLDVDGDTGGFNIQAACSTGVLAGNNIRF